MLVLVLLWLLSDGFCFYLLFNVVVILILFYCCNYNCNKNHLILSYIEVALYTVHYIILWPVSLMVNMRDTQCDPRCDHCTSVVTYVWSYSYFWPWMWSVSQGDMPSTIRNIQPYNLSKIDCTAISLEQKSNNSERRKYVTGIWL